MSRRWIIGLVFCGLAAAASPVQAARSAWEAGNRRAHKLGYGEAQSACFADVFSRYAHIGPKGGFTLAGGRSRRGPMGAELWNNCRVYW